MCICIRKKESRMYTFGCLTRNAFMIRSDHQTVDTNGSKDSASAKQLKRPITNSHMGGGSLSLFCVGTQTTLYTVYSEYQDGIVNDNNQAQKTENTSRTSTDNSLRAKILQFARGFR